MSLPHCSFTAPLVWFQLPLIFSQIVLASVLIVVVVVLDWACDDDGRAVKDTAAHAARMAIERMETLRYSP